MHMYAMNTKKCSATLSNEHKWTQNFCDFNLCANSPATFVDI